MRRPTGEYGRRWSVNGRPLCTLPPMGLLGLGASKGGQFSSIQAPALVALGIITLLLGLFLIAAFVLMRVHHRRLDAPRRSAEAPQPDAWEEAGRRMRVDE